MKNITELIVSRQSAMCCENMRQALKNKSIVETYPTVAGDFDKTIITLPKLKIFPVKDPLTKHNTDGDEISYCPFCGDRISQKLNIEQVEEQQEAEADEPKEA